MRILLAGASGFLGTALARRLAASGHTLVRLIRREPSNAGEVRWDPGAGILDADVLADVDAVINLAGAGVGDHRWTAAYKQTLRDSRLDTTRTLARALATNADRPRVLLNASAVGFYGDTGDRAVDEQSPPGQGFLTDICRDWEAATAPAAEAGVRVVLLRTGLPLSARGGLLKPLILPFRLGVGGRLGSGRQYLPWISLADWESAMEFLLGRDDIAGPVNITGPAPVTNAEFTRALGRAMHRPAVVPVPGFALSLVLGEFSHETLVSQRVLPAVLRTHGFTFAHDTVAAALAEALDRR
jgi:uncharacterized protein (TIGR01777 family)